MYQQAHLILKASNDFGFVLAPVLVPDEPDLQGDIVTVEDIEKAAHDYVESFQLAGLMHQEVTKDVIMVESYVVRSDTEIGGVIVKSGTWVAGFRIRSEKIRESIREKRFTGVSIGGQGERVNA